MSKRNTLISKIIARIQDHERDSKKASPEVKETEIIYADFVSRLNDMSDTEVFKNNLDHRLASHNS